MGLLDDLLATLPDAPVRTVLVGVHWTVVCSRGCGLASTIPGDGPHGHEAVRDVGRLHRKSARELAEYARSDNPVEAGVGVAAVNSLLAFDESRAVEVNASRVLAERGRGRVVAIVGSFPFIPRLREQVGELWVLEQRPSRGEHPATEAATLIPRADVVAITGSALVNGTLDGLLALCRPESLVMVLGPSTPLSPVLFDHGADLVSGARVVDEDGVLRTVAQGASFRQVEGVRLWTMERPPRVDGPPPPASPGDLRS
jgi:uncharacterized protein (DUF4213/DUF364 family)